MDDNKIKIRRQTDTFLYLILAVVIVINTGYYRSTVNDSYVPFIILIACAAALLFRKSEKNVLIMKNSSLLFILISVVLSTIMNINGANILSGGRVFVLVACIWFILYRVDYTELLKAITLVIKVVAAVSIVMTIIGYSVSELPFPIIEGTGGRYYDAYIYTAKADVERIYGIFWEPGVFASAISIAMIIDYFILKREFKLSNSVLYIVAMFMTKSTAGILILFIMLFGILWGKIIKRESIFTHFIFIIIVLLLLIFFEDLSIRLAEASPDIFGKLIEEKSSSKTTRTLCPLINLEIFFNSPLFGYGFTGAAAEFSYLAERSAEIITAQTSTSTQILSCIGIGGIFYTVALIAPLFDKNKLSKNTFVEKVTAVVAMLFIANKEPQIFFALTWVIVALFGSKDREDSVHEKIGTSQSIQNA